MSGTLVFLNHLFPLDSQGIKTGTDLVDIVVWLPLRYQLPSLEVQDTCCYLEECGH